MHRVTVWPHRTPLGWERGAPAEDKHGDPPPKHPVVSIMPALVMMYLTDAHLVPYRIKGLDVCPRINHGGLAALEARGLELVYDVILIDCDAPKDELCRHRIEGEGDRSKWPARDAWVARELVKLRDSPLWARCGWYCTRGGFRLLWLLPVGTSREIYLTRLAELRSYLASLGMTPDRLVDFGRCYRLPHVCRDGETIAYRQDFSRLGELPDLPTVTEGAEDFAGVDDAHIGPFELPETILDGARDDTLTSYAGQLRREGKDEDEILSALMLANEARCKPPKGIEHLRRIARSVTRYDPDPSTQGRQGLVDVVIRKGALSELVDKAQELIAQDGVGIYQRGTELVTVHRAREPTLGGGLGPAQIRQVDRHALQAKLASLARWVTPRKSGDTWTYHPADVPIDVVKALQGRREWPDLLPLTGIIETPTLRADGTVLDTPGYDEATGLVFSADRGFIWPVIHRSPTLRHSEKGYSLLCEITKDFPFAKPTHESVVHVAILSTIARPMIMGAVPLFIFDATTPGSGKSLLAHVVAVLATGHTAGVMIQTDAIEMEKRTTALLLASERVILIDNVDRPLGGAAIDGAITAEIWQGRRLGASEMVRMPNRAVWIATGNNIALKGDLARRCLRVYLVPDVERPEERCDFAHPDLLDWVRENRGRLVCAGLTIVYGYVVAGSPDMGLAPFGGFSSWSRTVRSALVWAGAPDPCDTRAEIRAVADGTYEVFATLTQAWHELFKSQHKTLRDVVTVLENQGFGGAGGAVNPTIDRLREALIELAGDNRGEISPRRAGWALRRFSGRIVNGLRFERVVRTGRSGVAWRVTRVGDVISEISADV